MSITDKILNHELWKNINMEKLPEFRVIERNIKQIGLLAKKNNMSLLEKLNSRDSSEFLKQLDEKMNADNQIFFKPVNFNENKRLIIKNSKLYNNFQNHIKNLKIPKGNPPKKALDKDLKFSNDFEDSEIIQEKLEKKNLTFLDNHDLLSPFKGNFSFSLKYYNNQEFLIFLTKKFNKDFSKINAVLNNTTKLTENQEEFLQKQRIIKRQKTKVDSSSNLKVKRVQSSKDTSRLTKMVINGNGKAYKKLIFHLIKPN